MNVKRVDILATGRLLQWNATASEFVSKMMVEVVEVVVVAAEAEEEEVTTGTRTI